MSLQPAIPDRELERRRRAVFDGGPVFPQDRRWLLRCHGITPQEAAQAMGERASILHEVLSDVRKSPRVRQAFAALVGVPVSRLWPEASP